MINRTIPDPGGPLLCGQVLAGEALCGEVRAADTWTVQPLDLPDGTAEVITTSPSDVPITVEVTGTLDLPHDSAEVTTTRSTTVVVEGSLLLDLAGDVGGDLLVEKNVTVSTVTGVLELVGDLVSLVIEVRFVLTDSLVLELAGVSMVIVNPILLPEVCLDLDLAVLADFALDLVPASVQELDLEHAACDNG